MAAEQVVHGVCPHDCYDTCGLSIHVEEGVITHIQGQLDHPITQGFLCWKVNHYLERLYHPDRLRRPLKRVGPKGRGQFREATWDEALSDMGQRLGAIRSRYGGEAILPYSFAGNMGLLSNASMDRRFFNAIGASELDRTICTAASDAALRWVYGRRIGPDPETIPDARLILLWGANPMATNVHEIPLLDRAREKGAEIWTLDPLKTETARRYQRHLALHPNTDTPLALGLGRLLIDRGLYDRHFVDEYSEGFDQYLERAWPWTLERVSEATGLTGALLEELAEKLATIRPLLLRTGFGVQRQDAGAQAVWAISALSILTGSHQDVGGGHLLSNGDAFIVNRQALTAPELRHGPVRTINMLELGDALNRLDSPPIKALVVYNANPAATAPDQAAVLRGLAREDLLTIVHEQMLTDTAAWADWVLPAAMAMEVLDIHTSYWHRYLQLNEPAVAPPEEAVSNTEFFRRLAKACGLTHPKLAASDALLIQDALSANHPWSHGITYEALQRQPVQKVRLPMEVRPFLDTPIRTPSGRLRLMPPPVAPFVTPAEDAQFPFHLISPATRSTIKSSFGNIKSLGKRGTPELLMCPDDMHRLGLMPRQKVRMYNHLGSTVLTLIPSDVPKPGTVVSYAVRWNSEGDGTNINQVTAQRLSDYGGGATFYSTRVNVESVASRLFTQNTGTS